MSKPMEICDNCSLPYSSCECCPICDETCADYCDHQENCSHDEEGS